MEPSAAFAPARGAPDAVGEAGGGQVGEFFAALGDAWRLAAGQRARLTPAVETALSAGWTPAALATTAGANTGRWAAELAEWERRTA
jgi:hypothetical protein